MEETVSPPLSSGRFGIGAKMAALVSAAVICTAAAWVSWSYHRLAEGLLAEEFGRQRVSLTALASQLSAGVEAARSDVVFLTELPPMKGIIEARRAAGSAPLEGESEAWWQTRLADIFAAKLRVEPNYFRIRLIDAADGREIVRVDGYDKQITRITGARLEERTNRPYFQSAIGLPAGAVYFSDTKPNEEDQPGPLAGIPVLRASSPVYDGEGKLFAVAVIDKDMRSRFARLRETLAARYKLHVFNEAGEFLLRPDAAHSISSRRREPSRVEEEFPGLWPLDPEHETEQTIVNFPGTAQTVIAGCHKLFYDRHPEHYYGLLITVDYDTVIAPSLVLRNQAVLFGSFLTVVTIATVLVFSRRLTRPLSQITDAVVRFTHGDFGFQLPTRARDEAGVLAQAFDDMFHRLRAHDAALRAEVAERRRAENALRGSEQRLQLALYAAAAGVWVWDADTGKTVWDRSMERLFGVREGNFGGTLQSWSRLVHADDWPAVEAALRRNASSDAAFGLELRAALPDGGWKHVKLRGTRVLGHQGEPATVIGICWDISDEKLAQERIEDYIVQLEQKNQEMEQFVYSVSHDLKAPLVTCKGFLGILREDLGERKTEQALASLQRLERAAHQMTRLIEDLLQFSRVGRATSKPETVDVGAVVRELAEEARRQCGAERLRIDIQDEMPAIVADPTAVSRLFQNLLDNAVKYGRGGPEPRIEIGGCVVEDEIRFFVRDNGDGIPEQFQHKVFGLFQRLDTKHEGTGLGLAIVSKIMSMCGGRVWVESAAGQGAAFWLAFPTRYAAPAAPLLTRSLA